MNKINALRKAGYKYIAAVMFFVLMLATSLIGVNAWLADASGTVTNKFDPAKLVIDLDETDTGLDDDESTKTNTYEMTVGGTMDKDPAITVAADTIDCWVFVTVTPSDNFSDFMSYEIDSGWTKLEGIENVWYRRSSESSEDQDFNILKDKTVTVNEDVTKEELNNLTKDEYPTLSITGFAVQLAGFNDSEKTEMENALAAWAEVNKES